MKKLLVLLGLVGLVGCAGFNPFLEDRLLPASEYAAQQLKAKGVDVSAKDMKRAIEAIQYVHMLIPEDLDLGVLDTIVNQFTNLVTVPVVSEDGSVLGGVLSAGFLEEDARIRIMNSLSENMSDEAFTAMLKRQRDFGFNQMLFFLANEGDGSPVPTTFYRNGWFGAIDDGKVEFMRKRIKEAKAMGFNIELWGIADDSSGLSRGTPEQIAKFYVDINRLFGDLTDRWCIGLEVNEWGKRWWNTVWPYQSDIKMVAGCVQELQRGGKPVAIHLTSYKEVNYALQSGADVFNLQFGWLKKESQMTDAVNWVSSRKGNMLLVATEFNRDSTTELATKLSTAAIRAGCTGTQTGKPLVTIPTNSADAFPYTSLKWGSEHRRPSGNVRIDPAQTLTVSSVKKDNIYFKTSNRPKALYPHEQDGGAINGRCYIFDANGSGGFFDSIRPNQQSRDFKNVHHGYCNGFALPEPGGKVYFFIASIDGRWRTPIAVGTVNY